ncbi:carbohydrate porin [Acetobacter conturbans]|uniref:Carbohydrate porin n=1 Tax=Acetobacter conturbans TaxID=1737472 RepID=A0ABX0K1E8_9PROT|nr:carbohydrate porin [Acetobacter conturbans]NHN87549.1 carbohydrate porin [Acetobacter conturbans]
MSGHRCARPAFRLQRGVVVWVFAGMVSLVSQEARAADWSDFLTDPGGWNALKQQWQKTGVDVSIEDVEELWSIPTGGARPSEHYVGLTQVDVTLDLARLAGENGREGEWGKFEISAMDLRGKPFSNYPLYAFNQTSSSEADPNLRLYELAYGWSSADAKFATRVGKLDLSQDFMVSTTALTFLNASFGWPMLPSNNLYGQGPASPVATPAVWLRYQFPEGWQGQIALADDNATGARSFLNATDPWNQNQDPSGTRFNFGTGAFLIGEVAHNVNHGGRTGTYKAGFYIDTGRFPLQADSDVSRRGNWEVYMIMDHTLLKDRGAGELRGFVRWEYTGLADRNQISSSLDAGMVLVGPFHRSNDNVGLGFGYAAPSHDLMLQKPDGSFRHHGNEYHLELTYAAQVLPWMTLQPDVQGLINPSGGAYDSGRRVKSALIFGLHLGLSF